MKLIIQLFQKNKIGFYFKEPGRKIYGVALPPSESEESDEENVKFDFSYIKSRLNS